MTSSAREYSRDGLAEMLAVRPIPGLALLMLFGEIDLTGSADVGAWVEGQEADRVVLDLSDVGFVAARSARRLAEAQQTLRRRGSVVRVVVSGNPVLSRVLRLVGSFDLYDSVAAACR
ncbi:STAS domain-containing protein [Pseudonocardia halophobica]|uniref:STAS domain-containing protein n=1 Tax=Pseudonocardia halophobica TaxID=29401 RepID=UPI003D903BCD